MKCFMSGEDCEYNIQEDFRKIFIISPFGYPFDDIYFDGIKTLFDRYEYQDYISNCPASRQGEKFDPQRADQTPALGFVMCQRICRKIQESEMILADISKPNPNVFYELGLSYGLKKSIILIGQQTLNEAYTFGLAEKSESYIHYRSMDDFDKTDMFRIAFTNSIKAKFDLPDLPNSVILNIINKDRTIKGLHENTLRDSMRVLRQKRLLRNDDWRIVTLEIDMNSSIQQIITELINCKVCVIDATIFGRREGDINPFMFFLLGVGHAVGKEVIPLTNTTKTGNILPFDVRGLWHIFFDNLEQLKSQFIGIMPEIDRHWYNEQKDFIYRKYWALFTRDKEVHIITCARDTEKPYRGPRTDIDKWDYTAVSELTRFLALKYPNSNVIISPPVSKYSIDKILEMGNDIVKAEVKNAIFDKDCIVIGSPDVSDIAEIVLSELHNIQPYTNERLHFKGYVMIKTPQPNKTSSFYWEKRHDEAEGIYLYEEESGDYTSYVNRIGPKDGKIYGVLIVADNPFVSPGKTKKIMILSGFSGIATYAIAKLVTDEKYKDELKQLDEATFPTDKNYEVLIGCRFEFLDQKSGDNRILKPDLKSVFFKGINKIT